MKMTAPHAAARPPAALAPRLVRHMPVVAPVPVVVQPVIQPVAPVDDFFDDYMLPEDGAVDDEDFDLGPLDMLGADAPEDQPAAPESGGWADAIRAAGDVGLAAYQAWQTSEAAKTAGTEEKARLGAMVAADVAVALADAGAASSAAYAKGLPQGKLRTDADARAARDKAALDVAVKAQERAAADLPAAQSEARVRAAGAALDLVNLKLRATPNDASSKRLAEAWQRVLTKAQNAQIVKGGGKPAAPGTPAEPAASFWDRKYGPFSAKQYAVGGGGLLAVLGLAFWATRE